ncbi:calcium-binding protein [Amaricoccus sp.]|uniref:calcium-binding protein n=1 Tax=Amaricoccus sp. TaxID=1872485 RepID=UPI001B582762|nr:calcium-binding protein [Amaricoccus sp.]MBP7241983.1 hypothetical protein [Amaricoccus sp.]
MSINNSREYLEWLATEGAVVTDHLVPGRNVQIPPGTYIPNWDANAFDSVTFKGTAGKDTLFGGGGEVYDFFLGTRGDDLYGVGPSPEIFVNAYADYSGAHRGVFVDMTYRGSRTFTDADGEVRTVAIVGSARDGFGGTDYFAESDAFGAPGFSSVIGVFGTSRRDVMIGGGGFDDFYGGAGDDLLIGGFAHGGEGDDMLIGRATGDFQYGAHGDEGDDCLLGTDFEDFRFAGGDGDDRIFARGGDDGYVVGEAGNDYVDGGAGDDFIDGGVGCDVLVSGSGSDIINPDVEFFQSNPSQPTDGARDVIRVTKDDLGAFRDRVLFNAFEEGIDEIRFGAAVRGGVDFRVYQETSPVNGSISTVLQIDHNDDGFGDDTPDVNDYFLTVGGADLSLHDGYLLT